MTNRKCKELMELWQRYAGHYGIDEFVQVLDRFDAERDRYRAALREISRGVHNAKVCAAFAAEALKGRPTNKLSGVVASETPKIENRTVATTSDLSAGLDRVK